MRRNVFQEALPEALALADGVILGAVSRSDQIPEAERLDPGRVARDLSQRGLAACYEPAVESIIGRLKEWARSGDVIVVFSNGGFDGLHAKLMHAFR